MIFQQAWTSTQILQTIMGLAVGCALVPFVRFLFHSITFQVEEGTAVLVTRFGKLVKVVREPGAHAYFAKLLPWVRTIPVSMHRDFRHYANIHVNDRSGTTLVVDLWIEFRITSPTRALFEIENWEVALQSLLTHSASSILGMQSFHQILENRGELGESIKTDILSETSRWGLVVEEVFIRQVSLLPEISRQMFAAVAARLERAKSDVEEEGRLQVAELEARTSAQIAALVAEAKGQHLLAVGDAYEQIADNLVVLNAYKELYELSLIRPHRTHVFYGFAETELKGTDAAMMIPPLREGASAGEPTFQ